MVYIAAAAVFAVLVLAVRIILQRRALYMLGEDAARILSADTNAHLTVRTGDRAVRALAARLDGEIHELRRMRLRYESGDRELHDAVANVSHDLRTPLTAICGSLDLLEGEQMSEDARRYVSTIRNRADSMRKLTEELFRYSIATDGELSREDVDLGRMIEEELADFYGALTKAGIELCVTLPPRAVVRSLDGGAVRRVLGNILDNAVKYSGGDLSVTLTEGGEMMFSNSAPGLSAVEAGRLFDRFYTVSTARTSTGLGLSVARSLVYRMGGTVSADCECGRLTVTVKFPAEAPEKSGSPDNLSRNA